MCPRSIKSAFLDRGRIQTSDVQMRMIAEENTGETFPSPGLFQTKSHPVFEMVHVEKSILPFGENQGVAMEVVVQIA